MAFENRHEFPSDALTVNEVIWVQTGTSGIFLLKEGTAPSTVANYAQIYAKSSDHLLYWKDSSGAEHSIGSGGGGMVYPGAGIPVSTGSAWTSSITNNSANWNTAYGWGNHASAGYLTDAPSDGTTYGRKNGAWSAASGGTGITWSAVTGDTSMAVNNAYIANKVSLITFTLPATAAVGSVVRVTGISTGGWKIAQNSGGIIHFGNVDSTTGAGGYVSSNNVRDSIELVCVVANNEWNAISSVGNITIV